MDTAYMENGSSLTVRGVLATLFGIAAVFWPGMTLLTLVYLFSSFILASGIIDLISGVGHLMDKQRAVLTRFMSLVLGMVELGVGIYLLRHPGVTFATLILLIGFSLIIRGVFEVVQGLFVEGPSFYRLLLVMVGLITGLAGIIVLFQPASAGVAFVWILGLYALITGPLLIALGLDVSKNQNR